MNKSVGDIIELVILMLFLSFGTTLGVKGLYDIYVETRSYSLEMEDKNAATKVSDIIFTGDYDTLLSQGEICLMTQIQDFGMPEPNSLLMGGKEVKIDTARFDNTLSYISALNTVFKDQSQYLIRYDYRTNTYYCIPYLKTKNPTSPIITYEEKEVVKKIDSTSASVGPMISVSGKLIEISAGAQNRTFTFSNVIENGKTYLLTFRAYSTADNDPLLVDAYPDDLPEKTFRLSKVPATYSWLVTIPRTEDGKSAVQLLRFFVSSEINKGKITVSNIELTEY